MSDAGRDVLLEVRELSKDYRSLRPLRVKALTLARGESLALLGFDQITAEVFVNLLTGAITPDKGEVRAFGQLTSDVADADAWLASLDRFGILSDRAVLLDGLTAEQNMAVPLTLELDPIPDAIRSAVLALAAEVSLKDADLVRPVGDLTPLARARVRLARAVALGPLVLLAEHPTATLSAPDASAFASDLARVARMRRLGMLVLTADTAVAAESAARVLTLHPATGELRPASGWRRWFPV